jgi:hypothetical protein
MKNSVRDCVQVFPELDEVEHYRQKWELNG